MMSMFPGQALMLYVGAYLVGSVPTGYLFVRLLTGGNIKQLGSGNSGATNAGRVLGWYGFLAVFLIDVSKAAFYLWRGVPDNLPFGAQVACALLAGNIFSCFLRGSGGKGFATYIGVLLYVAAMTGYASFFLWGAATFASVLGITRRVGIASVATVLISAFLVRHLLPTPALACMVALIVYAHRTNVRAWLQDASGR